MTILALEFSSPQRSVAFCATDGAAMTAEAVETGGHGTNAFGMIEQVLAEAKIEREQIDVLAVGLGPGSYTGIRAAISIAQGWQLARGVKLLGVSSAECLAAQARAENILGRVNVVIDAQRNEFYLATYEIAADGWRETAPLEILSLSEVQSRTGSGRYFDRPGGDALVSRRPDDFPARSGTGATGRAPERLRARAKSWSRFICGRRIL